MKTNLMPIILSPRGSHFLVGRWQGTEDVTYDMPVYPLPHGRAHTEFLRETILDATGLSIETGPLVHVLIDTDGPILCVAAVLGSDDEYNKLDSGSRCWHRSAFADEVLPLDRVVAVDAAVRSLLGGEVGPDRWGQVTAGITRGGVR